MIDLAWLTNNQTHAGLKQNVFFQVEGSTVLFLPQLKVLPVIRKAGIFYHADVLYDLEHVVLMEKTLAYLIYPKCPTVKVHANGVFLHQRKTIDTTPSKEVDVHNTLPHFSIVSDKRHTTTIFCRDVTNSPKT